MFSSIQLWTTIVVLVLAPLFFRFGRSVLDRGLGLSCFRSAPCAVSPRRWAPSRADTVWLSCAVQHLRARSDCPDHSQCHRPTQRSHLAADERASWPRYVASNFKPRGNSAACSWAFSAFCNLVRQRLFRRDIAAQQREADLGSRNIRFFFMRSTASLRLIFTPDMLLWAQKVAYRGYLTATFVNHNTAATFVGAGATSVVLLGIFVGAVVSVFDDPHAAVVPYQ